MVEVIEEYRPQNHPCPVVNVCPNGAISLDTPFSASRVNEELCTECGACADSCSAFCLRKQTSY